MLDSQGRDYLVVWLPVESVPDDAARAAWRHHFERHFRFPVVLAFVGADDQWTLRGPTRLLLPLKARRIEALPWQRILVETEERPPIPGDLPPPP